MLIFSVLCLLNAAAPQALQIEHVSGNVYRTKPPHQIAAFAEEGTNALLYANRLKDKNCTSSITTIKAIIGNHYIEKAHQTEGGWIVYHNDNASQTGRKFESYVVSAAASWETLKATISSTLANFMRDYKVAFSASASNSAVSAPDATTVVDHLLRLRAQSAEDIMEKGLNLPKVCPRFVEDETGMKQALSCQASLKIVYSKLEARREIEIEKYAEKNGMHPEKVSRLCQICLVEERSTEYTRLQRQDITEAEIKLFKSSHVGQAIMSLKTRLNTLTASSLPSELETKARDVWSALLSKRAASLGFCAFDASDPTEISQKLLIELPDQILGYLQSKTMFFRYLDNTPWGGNNCIFRSIGQKEGSLESVISHFVPNLQKPVLPKPSNVSWDTHWPSGGKMLRKAVFEFFDKDEDLEFIAALCSKESCAMEQAITRCKNERGDLLKTIKTFKDSIVSDCKETAVYLPLWLHEYISRKAGIDIHCLKPNGQHDRVLISQFETGGDVSVVTGQTVFVVHTDYAPGKPFPKSTITYDRVAGFPVFSGNHFDGLQYVRTGW